MKIWPKLVFLVVMLVGVGCSARGLGVKYADKLAMHEFDRWFDLTDDQEDEYGPQVKAEIQRLKKERLPIVVAKLEDFVKAWDRGPTEADAMLLLDEYDAIRVDEAKRLGAAAGKFLASLAQDQIENVEEKLADGNEKVDDSLKASPEDFAKKQRKETIKAYEHWLGSLSDEQEAQVLAISPIDRSEFERYRTQRLTSQQNFLELLKRPASPGEIEAKLNEWAKDPYKMRGATAEQGERRRQKMVRVITQAHAIANAEQRRHAKDELLDLIQDLRAASR